jgi:hypothetical protein
MCVAPDFARTLCNIAHLKTIENFPIHTPLMVQQSIRCLHSIFRRIPCPMGGWLLRPSPLGIPPH